MCLFDDYYYWNEGRRFRLSHWILLVLSCWYLHWLQNIITLVFVLLSTCRRKLPSKLDLFNSASSTVEPVHITFSLVPATPWLLSTPIFILKWVFYLCRSMPTVALRIYVSKMISCDCMNSVAYAVVCVCCARFYSMYICTMRIISQIPFDRTYRTFIKIYIFYRMLAFHWWLCMSAVFYCAACLMRLYSSLLSYKHVMLS